MYYECYIENVFAKFKFLRQIHNLIITSILQRQIHNVIPKFFKFAKFISQNIMDVVMVNVDTMLQP